MAFLLAYKERSCGKAAIQAVERRPYKLWKGGNTSILKWDAMTGRGSSSQEKEEKEASDDETWYR